MSHNSSGEGSISQRRDGRWQGALQIDGRRATVYGKTRSEVVEKLRGLSEQARKAGNRLPTATRLTLAEFVDDWLEQAEPRLRPGTVASYRTLATLHIIPDLGSVALTKLEPIRLSRHYARLSKTLSPRRVQMVHRLLHKTLGDACRWGLTTANPAALVQAPQPEAKEPTLWQPEQVSAFLQAVQEGEGGQYGHLFAFLLASGCREGEAFGLVWSDVGWDAASVRIDKQITWVKNQPIELPPKTRSGRRTIALPTWGVEALHRQRAQVAEWRLSQGEAWQGGEHVFTSETGTPPSPSNLRRALHAVCGKLGMALLRPHDLRHLHLSLLAMNGVPVRVAQQRAGHSSPMLTMRVYQHVLGDADRQAAEVLGRVLAR